MVKEKGKSIQKYIKDIEEMESAYPEYLERITDDVRHSLKKSVVVMERHIPRNKKINGLVYIFLFEQRKTINSY